MDTAKKIADEIADKFELSDSEIARRCNSSQATISRIRNEKVTQCGSTLYIELMQLREDLCSSIKAAA